MGRKGIKNMTNGEHPNNQGQLADQGRALALDRTHELITAIMRRVESNSLNRGFSLSLPYFDDRAMEMKIYDFEVIPAGRIPFDPAYVLLVARVEQVKVSQDLRLNASTRKSLLAELKLLEKAFQVPGITRFERPSAGHRNPLQIRVGALNISLNPFSLISTKKSGE
jgi:hypothetical protein